MAQNRQNKDTAENRPDCAQKLNRVKDKMVTSFMNACSNVGDAPQEAAYYYDRFTKYASLYGRHINKIFANAGKPEISEELQGELACKALGRNAGDVNRLAATIERKL